MKAVDSTVGVVFTATRGVLRVFGMRKTREESRLRKALIAGVVGLGDLCLGLGWKTTEARARSCLEDTRVLVERQRDLE